MVVESILFQAWRAQLGRFGLSGAHQTSPIKQLSDGLRNRWEPVATNIFLCAELFHHLQCRIRSACNGASSYSFAWSVLIIG